MPDSMLGTKHTKRNKPKDSCPRRFHYLALEIYIHSVIHNPLEMRTRAVNQKSWGPWTSA